MSTPRLAGARWRLLVHEWQGRKKGQREGMYGISHNVKSDPRMGLLPTFPDPTDGEWNREHIIPNTEFDELVVGQWCHIEQMDTGYYWMNISGVVLHVRANRDGRPTHVMVHGPGDWNEHVEGCTYELEWSAPAVPTEEGKP